MMRRRRAQSILEYSVLIIIIIGVLLSMNQYIKRGLQGRWKTSVDDFGEQYDPRLANSITTYGLLANADTVIQMVPGQNSGGQQGFYTNRVDNTHSIETKISAGTVGAFDPTSNRVLR